MERKYASEEIDLFVNSVNDTLNIIEENLKKTNYSKNDVTESMHVLELIVGKLVEIRMISQHRQRIPTEIDDKIEQIQSDIALNSMGDNINVWYEYIRDGIEIFLKFFKPDEIHNDLKAERTDTNEVRDNILRHIKTFEKLIKEYEKKFESDFDPILKRILKDKIYELGKKLNIYLKENKVIEKEFDIPVMDSDKLLDLHDEIKNMPEGNEKQEKIMEFKNLQKKLESSDQSIKRFSLGNKRSDENSVPVVLKTPCRKSEGVSFEEWYKRVNRLVEKKFGLSMEDFVDWRSRDSYESNSSVAEGFRDFKDSQDGDFDDLDAFGSSYKNKIIARMNTQKIRARGNISKNDEALAKKYGITTDRLRTEWVDFLNNEGYTSDGTSYETFGDWLSRLKSFNKYPKDKTPYQKNDDLDTFGSSYKNKIIAKMNKKSGGADVWNPETGVARQNIDTRLPPTLEHHQRSFNKLKSLQNQNNNTTPRNNNTPPPPAVVVEEKPMSDGRIMKTLKDNTGKIFKQIFDKNKLIYDTRGMAMASRKRKNRRISLAMIISKFNKK